MVTIVLTNYGPAQENIGTSRQPLVGGATVGAATQEEFGLLTLTGAGGTCSASLLRNDWAVTAAHCVEVDDATTGRPVPDPARPGQNRVAAPETFALKANWSTVQPRRCVRVETFRPYDVAIIRVGAPFKVQGSTVGYSRLIFQDGEFPYFGERVPVPITVFGRGISQFAKGSGATATQSVLDGLYRVGYGTTTSEDSGAYWFPSQGGQMIAGGDSGGPSFAWVLGGYALVGVHSNTHVQCLQGFPCGNWSGPGPVPTGYNPWAWATATPEAADAPVQPVWNQISAIMGPAPPVPPGFSLDSPPPGFIGTFAKTPANYQPMWVYGIRPGGALLWYRKNTGEAPWQGPKLVGSGWSYHKDVIAAGGNSLYGLTPNGDLIWYQHTGFNDGARSWKGPITVGRGWTFSRIFSVGDGIVYVITQDGKLVWYRHGGYLDGGGPSTWAGPKVIGTGWGRAEVKDVFSTGKGAIYVVKPDGRLVLYQHSGFDSGASSWGAERTVGSSGWQYFRQIVPVGDGVMLAIQEDGKMLWYKDKGLVRVAAPKGVAVRTAWKEDWEGPVQIGTGWQSFGKVVAIIPASAPPVVR